MSKRTEIAGILNSAKAKEGTKLATIANRAKASDSYEGLLRIAGDRKIDRLETLEVLVVRFDE